VEGTAYVRSSVAAERLGLDVSMNPVSRVLHVSFDREP